MKSGVARNRRIVIAVTLAASLGIGVLVGVLSGGGGGSNSIGAPTQALVDRAPFVVAGIAQTPADSSPVASPFASPAADATPSPISDVEDILETPSPFSERSPGGSVVSNRCRRIARRVPTRRERRNAIRGESVTGRISPKSGDRRHTRSSDSGQRRVAGRITRAGGDGRRARDSTAARNRHCDTGGDRDPFPHENANRNIDTHADRNRFSNAYSNGDAESNGNHQPQRLYRPQHPVKRPRQH